MPNEKRNPILKFFLDDTTLKRIARAVVADGNEVLITIYYLIEIEYVVHK